MNNCGAKTRAGRHCKQPAGSRTNHPGQGKCWLHGGRSLIKHGLRSKIKRATVAERVAEAAGDPKLLNLNGEVALLRVLVDDLLKARRKPDPSVLAMLVDKIGATVDRIKRHEQIKSVSLGTLNRVMEQMGVEVAAAAQEIKLDGNTSAKLFEAVERRWGSIRLDAYTTSDKRASSGE